jgi:proteasome lid subunit RPN8/RPN11
MWAMGLCISRRQYDRLLKWAEDAGEQECCGLLLGRGTRLQKLVLTDNVAVSPCSHFEIDPATLIAAEKAARGGDLAVLGYFHSHPNGLTQPSVTDADMAAADERIWLIIAADTMTVWRATKNGVLHNRFNPAQLAIDDDAQT